MRKAVSEKGSQVPGDTRGPDPQIRGDVRRPHILENGPGDQLLPRGADHSLPPATAHDRQIDFAP